VQSHQSLQVLHRHLRRDLELGTRLADGSIELPPIGASGENLLNLCADFRDHKRTKEA
jgi:hypothetical protein